MEAARKWPNIRRTVQMKIGNSLNVEGRQVPVYHDYAFADPDAMRQAGTTPVAAWVETAFISQGAGHRADALWQLDVFSRIGGEGEATGDPFGMFCEAICEALLTVFAGVGASGVQRGKFFINDYADPANPVATSMCLLMQNSRGDVGEPQEKRRVPFQDDYRRVTMTMRFRTIQDAAGQAAFYTD